MDSCYEEIESFRMAHAVQGRARYRCLHKKLPTKITKTGANINKGQNLVR